MEGGEFGSDPRIWNSMAVTAVYEELHRRRAEFERAVYKQFSEDFNREDAEDLVSEALDRALDAEVLPEPGSEARWFRRLLVNTAIDELRRRRGRPQSPNSQPVFRQAVLLSHLLEEGFEVADDGVEDAAEGVLERLGEIEDRAHVEELTRRALAALGEEDRRLLQIRHFELPSEPRERCAEVAGLSFETWRYRYKRAWEKFVSVVGESQPTPMCAPVRELIGRLEVGDLAGQEALDAHSRLDVHVVDCPACRVFARESYRALELLPVAPAGGLSIALADRIAAAVDRNGAEATAGAGAAAGGAGLWALLGSGGAAKMIAVICGISATAAGICGAVYVAIRTVQDPPPTHAAARPHAPVRPERTPSPVAAIPTPTPRPTRRVAPKARAAQASTTAASSNPPAAIPSGASGREFDPVPANAKSQPAPVPAGVSGEFSP
jgi:RNA polymerase sigma factor (sigma-70 family)